MANGHSKETGERDNGGRTEVENYAKRTCIKVTNVHYKHNLKVRKKRQCENNLNFGDEKIYND